MDIKIEGNPGTGNTFQEIHINNVETYAPNATTVVNNHYGDRKASPAAADPATGNADRIQRRAELLQYAGNLRQYVAPGWKTATKAFGVPFSNCPKCPPPFTSPAGRRTPRSTAIWWRTSST